MVRVHSVDSLKEQRRQGTHEAVIPFYLTGNKQKSRKNCKW